MSDVWPLRILATIWIDRDEPFLLIVRTRRIFTVHILSMRRVPDGYSGFPAYSRMQSATLLLQWATNLP